MKQDRAYHGWYGPGYGHKLIIRIFGLNDKGDQKQKRQEYRHNVLAKEQQETDYQRKENGPVDILIETDNQYGQEDQDQAEYIPGRKRAQAMQPYILIFR